MADSQRNEVCLDGVVERTSYSSYATRFGFALLVFVMYCMPFSLFQNDLYEGTLDRDGFRSTVFGGGEERFGQGYN